MFLNFRNNEIDSKTIRQELILEGRTQSKKQDLRLKNISRNNNKEEEINPIKQKIRAKLQV